MGGKTASGLQEQLSQAGLTTLGSAWDGGGEKQPAEVALGRAWSIVPKGTQHQAGRINITCPLWQAHLLAFVSHACQQLQCRIHAVLHRCRHLSWCEGLPTGMPLLQGERLGGQPRADSLPGGLVPGATSTVEDATWKESGTHVILLAAASKNTCPYGMRY